jgi:hypothetical protein
MAGRAGVIRARLTYAVRRGGPATFNAASAPACSCHRCERLGRDHRRARSRAKANAVWLITSHNVRLRTRYERVSDRSIGASTLR